MGSQTSSVVPCASAVRQTSCPLVSQSSRIGCGSKGCTWTSPCSVTAPSSYTIQLLDSVADKLDDTEYSWASSRLCSVAVAFRYAQRLRSQSAISCRVSKRRMHITCTQSVRSRRALWTMRHAALAVDDCRAVSGIVPVPAAPELCQWVASLPLEFLEIFAIIESIGGGSRAWVVGGSIRDLLSGAPPREIDLCSTLDPATILRLFPQSKDTGARFGTVTIIHQGFSVECTTLREDSMSYSDGRRPDSVLLGVNLQTDLQRRDFTINAMALDVKQLLLYDPFGGAADCKAKVLRAVGDASERLHQDGLRAIRAYRFLNAPAHGLAPRAPDAALAAALRASRDMISLLSRHRVTEEMRRILGGPSAPEVVHRMAEDGTLQAVLAGAGPCRGDCRETHAVRALWEKDASKPLVEPEFTFLRSNPPVTLWLEALVLLLGPAQPDTLSAVCGDLKLQKHERAFVLLHGSVLENLPEPDDVKAIRCFASALGEEDTVVQLRVSLAWAESELSAGARCTSVSKIKALQTSIASLRPGSIAPVPLADGRWIMTETGCRGAIVGKLKAFLYFEQVTRDVQNLNELKSILEELDFNTVDSLTLPQVQWPIPSRDNHAEDLWEEQCARLMK